MDAHTHQIKGEKDKVYILDLSELSTPPDKIKFCAGIHPWKAVSFVSSKDKVEQIAKHDLCVGIGETGLDRLYPDWDLQQQSLQWHWDLAEGLQKPLILHLVKTSSDILALLKARRAKSAWIWHDFQGPKDVATKILKLHSQCYFSFGPRSMKRPDFRHLWDEVPGDLRLIETDDSGLSIEEVLMMSKASVTEMSKNFHTAFSL